MADIENGIHDSLVATAEPDEEASRRRRERIVGVFYLVQCPMIAVEFVMCVYYYGIKNSTIPIWAIACIFGLPAIILGCGFYSARDYFRRIIREICNPEDELQVDAEGYLS
jgi:hypothetical protein